VYDLKYHQLKVFNFAWAFIRIVAQISSSKHQKAGSIFLLFPK